MYRIFVFLLLHFSLFSYGFAQSDERVSLDVVREIDDLILKIKKHRNEMAKNDIALHSLAQIKELVTSNFGPDHFLMARYKHAQSSIFLIQGNYEEFERLTLECKTLCETNQDTSSLFYSSILIYEARAAYEFGNLNLSINSSKKAARIRKSLIPYNNISYLDAIITLAYYKGVAGEIEGSIRIYEEAVELYKAEDPTNKNIIWIYQKLCREYDGFEVREKAGLEAIEYIKYLGLEGSNNHGEALNALARLYLSYGNSELAEQYLLQTLEILQNNNGEDSYSLIQVYPRLNSIYRKKKDFLKCQEILASWWRLLKVTGNENRLKGIWYHSSKAFNHIDYGETSKAESEFLRAMELRDSLFSESPNINMSGIDLDYIKFLISENKVDQALLRLDSLQAGIIEHISIKNPFYILCELQKLMLQDSASLMSSEYLKSQEVVLDFLNEDIRANSDLMSPTELEYSFLTNYLDNINKVESLLYDHPTHPLVNKFLDLVSLYKSLQLKKSKEINLLDLEQSSPAILEKYYALLGIKRNLIKAYEDKDFEEDKLDSLNREHSKIEQELSRASQLFAQEELRGKADLNQYQQTLKENEALIEFSSFDYYKPNRTGQRKYGAYILSSKGDARFVPLFDEKELAHILGDDQIKKNDLVQRLYNLENRGIVVKGKKIDLYKLIWQPLEVHLKDVDNIYFSSSGLLHRINFNAIPVGNDKVLAELYNLNQIFSSSSLLSIKEDPMLSRKSAYLIGGADYNVTREDRTESLNNSEGQLESEQDLKREDDESWQYLRWTKDEVTSISKMLEDKDFEVNSRFGMDASEDQFKLDCSIGNSPGILHLATHGYFYPKVEEYSKEGDLIFKISENPMFRSGLIMAGANKKWTQSQPEFSEEDGILTAWEISTMDLRNTKLAVLSACETGLGDIRGSEGVFGLQRAFKNAGVESLIISLWQVPDRESSLFMKTFYEKWLAGLGIQSAFKATQMEMRERFFNPYQWAGFVLIE